MVYAIGRAFAAFVRPRSPSDARVARRPRHARRPAWRSRRPSSPVLLAAGLGVVDLGLASTDLLYFASGRLDAPGAMLTASHNPARYNGIKCCLAGAVPIGQETGLAEIRPTADAMPRRAAPAPSGARRRRRARSSSSTCSTSSPRTCTRSSTSTHFARSRSSPTPRTAWGASSLPASSPACPSTSRSSSASSTAASRTIRPTRSSSENLVDLQARLLAHRARTSGSPSTATPTGSSSSTTRPCRSPARRRRRSSRPRCSSKHPGATVLYNLICSKTVPEVIAERGGVAVRTRVGHSFIKKVMADTGRGLRRRALGPLLLPRQLTAPTRASSPPSSCSR